MQNKLLLVDGQDLLFQMLFGMPNKILGKNGQNIEGVWGFTQALLKMIDMFKPTHILVIFDKEHKKVKRSPSDFYKNLQNESEEKEEKNPLIILPEIKKVLEELHISYFETKKEYGLEDYIKEYCKQYENKSDIIISSWDYDLIGLINEHVSLLTYKGKSSILYTPEKVMTKWKVKPEFFADYKALVGDNTNNIAGIPRVGPKMATNLIKNYGHVEDILKNISLIPKENVRLTLDIFQKDLLQNIQLIRLKGTSDIPITLEHLKWENEKTETKEILKKVDLLEAS